MLDAVGVDGGDRNKRIADLFDAHYAGFCRLAYLIVGDRAVAEEVVMDTFVHTFVGWRRIRDLDCCEAYLRRGVVNLSRTRSRRSRVEERSNAATWHAPAPAGGWNQDTHATDSVIWDAVRALPERQRATVALRYYADLSEADIASTLGCSRGTVKSQLAKARATLKRVLAGDDGWVDTVITGDGWSRRSERTIPTTEPGLEMGGNR
jgi:RNA polymerase sigma-70 factor (sigma-E family)